MSTQLRKLLDVARVALSVLLGVLTWVLAHGGVLGLPSGWTGVIVGAVALLTHLGIRAFVVPWLSAQGRAAPPR